MAKNTDNEAGVNMNDFSDNLPPAIANEKAILETAHILKSLCTFDAEVPIKEYFSGLKKVYQTLDMALEWLERSTRNANAEMENHDKTQPRPLGDKTDGENKDNVGGKQPNTDAYQKMEGILSGLYHITECGSHAYLVGLVKLSSEMLDLPYNLFSAKRKHIKECIKEVEKETKKVSALVDTACDILQEIIKDDQFNSRKVDVLNTKIQQAKLIIETCKKFLSNAKESIDELMPVMSVMKYLSRLSRIAGFGVTVYWLYYNISTFDSLATYIPGLNLIWEYLSQKPIPFVAACTASGYAWLSLFPSRAYAFRDGLKDLKLEHQRLTYRLDGLEKRLDAAREDILKKSKQ